MTEFALTEAARAALAAPQHPEYQYLNLLEECLEQGTYREGRNGGTYGLFGRQIRFDLQQGFPLLTTKKMFFKGIVTELLFFLGGHTNRNWLNERGVGIWDEWGDANGNLGPIYSHQWRHYAGEKANIPQPEPRLPENLPANIYGVACADFAFDSETVAPWELRLFDTWKGMVARCYVRSDDSYSYYGAKGVHVSDRWLVFSNFYSDVQRLSGWQAKLADWHNYHLDKDLHGDGFRYSPASCAWVTRSDNRRETYRYRHFIQNDDGRHAVVDNPVEFYTKHDIHQGNFCSMLRGERPVAKGWRLIDTVDRKTGIDQIAKVIDGLRKDPYGRRHIVTAWNPAEIDDMALPPCHCLFQFFVSNGKLSCQLYQRSADIFLGVPFNIASYALLTHLIAKEVGLEVGEFVHTFGDVHLYANHVDQAEEQLRRVPLPLPYVEIVGASMVEEIGEYQPENIFLGNYESHPAIKAEVSA